MTSKKLAFLLVFYVSGKACGTVKDQSGAIIPNALVNDHGENDRRPSTNIDRCSKGLLPFPS